MSVRPTNRDEKRDRPNGGNWLNQRIGDTTLADIKNEVAKQLIIKMRAANLADKTIVNYFQAVKSVVASAVSSEGEQLYPRNWNFHFIGLPVVDEKKQRKPSFTTHEVEQILARAKGRYKMLFALLAGTGMRIGEALGLKIGEHLFWRLHHHTGTPKRLAWFRANSENRQRHQRN